MKVSYWLEGIESVSKISGSIILKSQRFKPLQLNMSETYRKSAEDSLDILIIGAGLSGIGAARHLQKHCPSKRWEIVDSRNAVGGTWDLFRYPGVRSDSDMYTLGYNFMPWKERKAIADGADIRSYIERAADEGHIKDNLQLGQRVTTANWVSAEALWHVTLCSSRDGAETTKRARFIYFCSGYYSYTQAHQPEFAGQGDFAGRLIHPQFWPQDLDYSGKKVVVIGSGATAVTLVPEMAKTAAHVTMLQRSPSYVISRPSVDKIALALDKLLPSRWAYAVTRWKNVLMGMYFYSVSKRKPAKVKEYLLGLIRKEMGSSYEVGKHFSPNYGPWDQRVCAVPDSDLFNQIKAGRATIVTDTIERMTGQGILLTSGQEIAADVIVTATGLKLSALGDVAISKDELPYVLSDSMAYKGLMLSDLPNAALAFGYINASWTLRADLTSEYVCRLLNHMDRYSYRVVYPKADPTVAPQAFMSLSSGYVQRSQEQLPKQGDRAPWKVKPSYWADLMLLRWSKLEDGVLQLEK
jgi:monooxygenase